jgi:hypothetical protein
MIKITSSSSENFTIIENSLAKLDPNNIFLSYFDSAEEITSSSSADVTVVLKNSVKFTKDLNIRKYVVTLPHTLTVDSFEYVTGFENTKDVGYPHLVPGMPAEIRTNKPSRKATYSVVVKCHMTEDPTVDYVFVLVGFNDSAIRIMKDDDASSTDIDSVTSTIVAD